VVGASPESGGARFLQTLSWYGFQAPVYPVNPKYDQVLGWKCYPSVTAIGEPVDLVAIRVPADHVAGILRDCVAAGAGAAIIFSAGFIDDERGRGKDRQAEIESILAGSDLVVAGPNTLGYFNVSSGIACTTSPGVVPDFIRSSAPWIPEGDDELRQSLRGNVAVLAQSGGLSFSVFSRGVAEGVGFSHVVSLGNEVDLDVLDCAEYLITQPDVRVIAMYVEGFRHPERLPAVAEAARAAGTALVIGKAGASAAGRAAALSHTGHLAGESMLNEAVFRRHGIITVSDQDEMLDACWALSTGRSLRGSNVVVASLSGGSGVWTCDALERAGFELPPIDAERQQAVSEVLPDFANIRNPIDVTGASAVGLAGVMRVVGKADYLDAVLLITTLSHDMALGKDGADLQALVAEVNKPIVAYTYTEPSPAARRTYRVLNLPLFTSSTRCVRALAALRAFARMQEPRTESPVPADLGRPAGQWPTADNRGVLTERQTSDLLRDAGFPVARHYLAVTEAEAVQAAEEIGGPVAMKLQAPSLAHKAAGGGVLLDVNGEDAVRAAFGKLFHDVGGQLPDRQGVLVQEMVSGGLEMLAGVHNTSGFGPVMILGFGGSHVERLNDVAMACAPLTEADAVSMIESLRHGAILSGSVAGAPRYDRDALVRFLVRLSQWAVRFTPAIAELDINPVIVGEQGVVILDSLLVTKPGRA
jgi:acetate---CoA ligase (ADP-forming)